jgi:3-deoxy-D-manno-octulosonate 8-phosphate phosphatase (KDO 8-P phosphatase)
VKNGSRAAKPIFKGLDMREDDIMDLWADKSFLLKIEAVRLLMLDVDGVLTDGKIIINDQGFESKHFDVRDGHGLKLLMRYGVGVALVTGRRSSVVEHRAKDLGIEEVYQGIWNKVETFEEILRKMNLHPEQTAFVGDDIVDIPIMRRVGFAVAVRDAAEDTRRVAHYVTKRRGGRGAVREVCELILKVQDHWQDVAMKYQMDGFMPAER